MPRYPVDENVLAQQAYEAYGDAVEWKNHQGNPMPPWADLGDSVQSGWIAAAQKTKTLLVDYGPQKWHTEEDPTQAG